MNNLWHKYSPWFHLTGLFLTMAFTAGIVWANVGGYKQDIDNLKIAKISQEKKIARMDYNIQLIGRAVGIKPLSKGDDE